MALRSPEATIDFLLTCMDCTEGKTDWEKVATKTGWYKAGKFSQAFTTSQKKYTGTEIGGANTGTGKDNTKESEEPKKSTAKATKKRVAEDDVKEKESRVKKVKKSQTEAQVGDDDGDLGESGDGSVGGASE